MRSKIFKRLTLFCAAVFLVCCAVIGATVAADVRADGSNENARYYDAPGIMPYAGHETITYSRKEEENLYLPYNVPYYYEINLENACGPVAGAIVVGYYNKAYSNLMNGYVNYYPATGKYKYQDKVYVPQLVSELYTLMRTNVDDVGVSRTDCLNGLKSYVNGKNLSITYTSIKSTSFNETAYRTAMTDQKPVLLFCNTVHLVDFSDDGSEMWVSDVQTSSDHIVIGCGIKVIKYYNANNVNFRTDKYLKVATGWTVNTVGFVNINSISWMDNAYVVNVY